MYKILFLVLSLTFSLSSFSQTLHLYGGQNHDVYLGCLNCSDIDSDSIWNDIGTYGNNIHFNSIWNNMGTYGNDVSNYSPWSNFASYPPVIVDKQGNFYGYLTVNEFKSKRVNFKLALILYKYHNNIKDDVSEWYRKLFE